MSAYLCITEGARRGANYWLDSSREQYIGRGMNCAIVLSDPLSSREHASLFFQEGAWWVRDLESRNGTFVNDQRIDEAQLAEGSTLRIGSTRFLFSLEDSADVLVDVTQTIVRDVPLGSLSSKSALPMHVIPGGESNEILLLYQLGLRLLSMDDPDEVVEVSLELLRQVTAASVVGFLWVSDEGDLKLKRVAPQNASEKVTLSSTLTKKVVKERRAVWVDSQTAENETQSLRHFADAICVPLIDEHSVKDESGNPTRPIVGAVHLYLEEGRFQQSSFDFALSLASMLSVALVRARRQARLKADHSRLADKSGVSDELIGESKPMVELKSKITRIALSGRTTSCVLVRGESGSGKELVARALHRASNRSDRPMLSVNCAAIPAELMESQLFGHKKGAFTSAENDHQGWFQQADSGTLFLDEVGEMTLAGQAKMLRILEGHPFSPVGGIDQISVDVRVIAATNRDLQELVKEKTFREDLYFRLSGFELYIPPLRDRGADIEKLVEHFFQHFCMQHGRLNLTLSREAREKMLTYQWPGNVRQLRNVLDSAVVMADSDTILPEDLGLRESSSGEFESLRIDHWERKLIREALNRTSGSVPAAAKVLGIGRATLYRKIEDYGITRP